MTTCTVLPILALAAIRRNASAWQAWQVARSLDTEGSGRVNEGVLLDEIARLTGDIGAARYKIKKAIEAGFIWRGRVLSYVSPKRLAEMVGAKAWDKRKVEMPLEALFEKKTWRKAIWSAALVEVASPEKPISRKTLVQTTGVNKRRQLRLERSNGRIHKTPNVVGTQLDSSHLRGLWELNGRQFLAIGGRVYRQIGNTFQVTDERIQRAAKGRCKKIRTADLSDVVQVPAVRYFNEPGKAEKRARKGDVTAYFSVGEKAARYRVWREVR